MPFVVDASVAGTWVLPDEHHSIATEALDLLKKDEAYVPAIFWFEIRNLLISGERRQRISSTDTAKALDGLQTLPILVDTQADSHLTLQLARDHRLSIYDSAYLELAVRRGFPLLTLDAQLNAAARILDIASH